MGLMFIINGMFGKHLCIINIMDNELLLFMLLCLISLFNIYYYYYTFLVHLFLLIKQLILSKCLLYIMFIMYCITLYCEKKGKLFYYIHISKTILTNFLNIEYISPYIYNNLPI